MIVLAFWVLSFLPTPAGGHGDRMLGATFKFFHPASTSTCFLMRHGEEEALFLVTTAHTVEKTNGEKGTLVLRVPQEDGSYQRKDHEIPIRRGDDPLWVKHPQQDVAVLRLEEPLPVEVEALSSEVLASEEELRAAKVEVGTRLLVLTYPQRFEANGAGFPVARQAVFASPPLLPSKTHPTFLADYTTFAGDSGGPVFMETEEGSGEPMIVGLVLAQHHHVDKMKSEYEEREIRYPLGMGTVLHARYILETLELAGKGN
ncbi:MAG: trypsin-like peptidase domain-containing protein [Verrucomicrobiae bacterium]|nr:trypsin-like peptidase domain-containing protein [Verrucomicrobiae bacterium]MCP5532563.1 trypsin-like peptidase domain-containing protein [Akkermansiaceae bacterium]MCP5545484.1 trypsin-like peptidase domain-containing protein [Akkermansiaceae bacterium]MCP5545828.1 trypsin-like peptidase domain-containing protein [Akkermansiaceae bacterium]